MEQTKERPYIYHDKQTLMGLYKGLLVSGWLHKFLIDCNETLCECPTLSEDFLDIFLCGFVLSL